MFRFLHLADLHLGWEPGYLDAHRAKERRKRRDALLARAVDFALASELDLVVIAGDLFETHRPAPALLEHTLAQLGRLREAGIAVVTTPGNHDEITYSDSVYGRTQGRWPGILVINPLPEEIGILELGGERVFLYSLAYTGGVTPASRPLEGFPRNPEPGFHLAIFHGTIGSGGERSLPLSRTALQAADYDYVALGHIHLPSIGELGRTKVVYSGCIEGKGFDDRGVPYWTVVEAQNGRCRIEQVPIEIQPIVVEELDLTQCESEQEVEARLVALADEDALVRVRLTGSLHFDLDPQALRARFAGRFYHLEVRDESDSVAEGLLAEWAAERTVRGAFVRRMSSLMEGAASPEERMKVTRALRYGIRALRGAS